MRNSSENVKRCIRNRKQNLIKIFGSKCCICGFDSYISALEFHHVIPEEKEFALSSTGLMKEMPKQLVEAKKCILVCANCHRGIHYEDLVVPNNWQKFFDEEIAKQILQEYYQNKEKKITYCIDCGKEIDHKSIRCEKCSAMAQRRVKRPNREELKNLIRNFPFVQIGQKYGVSDNAIRKWCLSENLPSKKTIINQYTDEEWELL